MTVRAPLLAIDPGTEKCGLALLTSLWVLERRVVPLEDLARVIREWMGRHPIAVVVVGDRTGSSRVHEVLRTEFPTLAVHTVDEAGATLEARRLYFADHPPRGWRRFLPLSLQLPPRAYDDYSAVVLGRRFLARSGRP